MNVVMIGGTGAVGTELLRTLVAERAVTQITLLGRRKVGDPLISASPKVQEYVVDLFDPRSYTHLLANHTHAFSTLGVGQPSKVSREEYFKIDYTGVKEFAAECKRAGVKHFSALVSVGANIDSKVYYLRVKGMLEKALLELQFERVSFFEPSMIVTPQNRYGISQWLTLKLYPVLIDPWLVGGLSRYRSVTVEGLGRAMAQNILTTRVGPSEYLRWEHFRELAK